MRTRTLKARLFAAKPTLALCAVALLLSTWGVGAYLASQKATAATASTINFQAKLMSNTGAIAADGDYNVEFKIYNASSSSGSSQGACTGDTNCLWTETRTSTNKVHVANGYLTVSLGSVTPFASTIKWDQDLWLTMRVGGTGTPTWDTEMSPRLKLTAVPYAFRAGQLGALTAGGTSVLQFASGIAQDSLITLPDPGVGGTATVCYQNATACGFATTNSGNFIQNGTAVQAAANFNIRSAATGSVGGIIQGAGSGQSVDLFDVQTYNGTTATTVFGVNNVGDLTVQSIGVAANKNITFGAGSGSFDQSSATTGTFKTGGGAVSLNGPTTVTGSNAFTVNGGLSTLQAGLTVSGAAVQLNVSSNNNTSINTGTSTGSVTIGNGAAGTLALQSGSTIAIATTNFNVTTGGLVTLTGGLTPDITTAVTGGVATALMLQPGTTTTASSTGPDFTLRGATDSGTGGTGGALKLQGGNATGGSGTLTGGAVNIDGGTGSTANGSVLIGGTVDSAVTIGKTTGQSIITLGQSTATNTINIGSAITGSGNTQTINIGNGAGAGTAISVNILSGVGTAGTGALSLGNNTHVTTIDVGNATAAATRTITIGGGANGTGVNDVVNIATGNTTTAGNKIVHIADGTPGGTGTNAVTIGSISSAGNLTTIQGGNTNTGTGAISIQAASGGVITIGTSNANPITLGGITTLTNVGTTNNANFVCRNATNQLAACDSAGNGAAFVQGGNANFTGVGVLGTTNAQDLEIVTGSTGPNIRAYFDQANHLYLGNGVSAGAPNSFSVLGTASTTAGATPGGSLTFQAGAGASTTTGSAGGSITVQGGTAGGSNNNAGGDATIQGGTAVNTGAGGTLKLFGGTSATGGTNGAVNLDAGSGATTPNGTISVGTNNASTINIGSVSNTAKGTAIHIGDTSNTTNAQTVFVGSAANNAGNITTIQGGSGAITAAGIQLNSPNIGLIGTNPTVSTTGANTLTLQTGGGGNLTIDTGTAGSGSVALGSTNAATINIAASATNGATVHIGDNATAHTVTIGSTAGASSTTVQAGTGNLILQTNSSSAAVQVQSDTNSATAFQVQNAATANLLNVDTTDLNLILNPGGEVAFGTEWAGYQTGGSVARTTTAGQFYNGVGAVSVTTGTTNTAGGKNNIGVALTNGTPYVLSFWAKLSSGAMTDLQVGISKDGTTGTEQQCGANFTLSTTVWTHYSCTVTPSASGNTSAYVFFRQANTGTSRTFFIDNVGLTATTNATTPSIKLGGAGATTVLTLDQAAGSPTTTGQTALLGSMFYNTTTGHVQCYEDNGVGGSWGDCGNTSLQQSYSNSTGTNTAEIILDSTRNGVDIQDRTSGTLGGTIALFSVRGVGTANTLGASLFTVNGSGQVGIKNGDTNGTTSINYDLSFGQNSTPTTRTIGVETQGTSATNGNALTISSGTGNTSGTGGQLSLQAGNGGTTGVGGIVALQGGTGGASGNGNGGDVTLQGGTKAGTGVNGVIQLKSSTIFVTGTFSSGTSTNITGIDNNSAIVVTATTTGLTFTVPTLSAPSILTAGRILYITNANSGSNAFTLAGAGSSFTLNTGSTATLFWNGTAWTSAGVDASTLQNVYSNSTGGNTPEILADSTRNGVDIQDNSLTAGTLLLAVRGTATSTTLGTALFAVDNTGKVGVGTGTLTRQLNVATSSSSVNTLPVRVAQSGTGDVGIELSEPAGTYYLGIDATDNKFKLSSDQVGLTITNMGITAAGPLADVGDQNTYEATRFSAPASGTISTIYGFISTVGSAPNNKGQAAIYSDVSGTPGTRLGFSTGDTILSPGVVNAFPISSTSVTSGTFYWLVYNSNGTTGTLDDLMIDHAGLTGQTKWYTNSVGNPNSTYGTWNATWTATSGTSNDKFSMYAPIVSGSHTDDFAGSLLQIGATGQTAFQNSTDSATAFQVQNAIGTTVFNVDASNQRVGIGTTAPSTDLAFGGGANRIIGVEAQTTANTAGASLTAQAAAGNGTGAGGLLTLQGGAAAATAGSAGGAVKVAGNTGSTTGTGGVGGAVTIQGGNAGGSGNNAGGNVNVQLGASTGTGAVGMFQVLNSAGASVLTVDPSNTASGTSSLNLINNGGAEAGSPPTSWSAQNGGVISADTTTVASGTQSADVSMGTTQNRGVKVTFATAPTASTTVNYVVSFSVRQSAGTAIAPGNTALQVLYSPDNGTTLTATCSNYSSSSNISANAWTKVSCTFIPGSTTVTTALLIIRQADTPGSARTIIIDNLSVVQQNSSGTQNVGDLKVGGAISQGLTLFTLDSYAATPFTSTNPSLAGSMYFDTTQGKIQCYDGSNWGACGAAPNTIVTLSPEFANAVLHATGTSSIGTMTSDFCSNTLAINDGSSGQPTICVSSQTFNFYKWTSPQSTAQQYSIFVTYQLPSTFKNFVAGQTSLTARTDSANSTVQYSVYRNHGGTLVQCGVTGTPTSVSTGSQSNWLTVAMSGNSDPSTCVNTATSFPFAANDSIVFKIDVIASNNSNSYVTNLNFQYSNQ